MTSIDAASYRFYFVKRIVCKVCFLQKLLGTNNPSKESYGRRTRGVSIIELSFHELISVREIRAVPPLSDLCRTVRRYFFSGTESS